MPSAARSDAIDPSATWRRGEFPMTWPLTDRQVIVALQARSATKFIGKKKIR